MNGLLAGMVATCSRCNSYCDIWVSTLVGFFGAFGYFCQDWLFENDCALMTQLEPWLCTWEPVWWVRCYWDSLRKPNMSEKIKIFEEYFMMEMENNWVGRLSLFLYTFAEPLGLPVFCFIRSTLKCFDMLQVSRVVELLRMDLGHHGSSAYSSQSIKVINVEDDNVLEPVEESKVWDGNGETAKPEEVEEGEMTAYQIPNRPALCKRRSFMLQPTTSDRTPLTMSGCLAVEKDHHSFISFRSFVDLSIVAGHTMNHI
jgi:hypothetical protein